MSLSLRLILALAGIFACGFGAVGYAAVWITGETVERDLERRVDLTLRSVSGNPRFFLIEAAQRAAELRQIADISGFEIVVPGVEVGSSLDQAVALRFLRESPDEERFTAVVAGEEYRVVRATVAGRTLFLLSPAASVERAKREARRPVLLVSGLGLLAAVVLGGVLASTVTRPLRRLAERAAEVREGRLDVAIPRGGGREVESLARAFERMLEGLARYREELVSREKMATLGRFSAAAAHEIRNPLSSLRMTVEMLRRDADEETASELDFLLSEMSRLDHSVEELLFHAGTPHYEMVETDLRAPLADTVRTLDALAEHLGVALDSHTPEEAVSARADAGKLRQALTNLVLNGLQASEAGGSVEARLFTDGEHAVFEVADRGPGIAEEIAERLFEPFVSGREGGTGLGLAVTLAIAEAHGGEVRFVREGGTTRFTLRLPRGEG